MRKKYFGSCLCGAVRYEVDRFNEKIGNCHCTMCRKFTGAAYATYAEVAGNDFRWLQGEDLLQDYIAANGTTRRFCQNCGAGLVFLSPNGTEGAVELAIATLDDDLEIEPVAHIYVESKASWVSIADGKPQYQSGSDSPRLDK